MNPIAKLFLASVLSQGAHTQGHFTEGDNQGVPMNLHVGDLKETWTREPNSKAREARIHGAGFRTQDLVSQAMDDTELGPLTRLASSMIKGGYVAGVPQMVNPDLSGDLEGIRKSVGKNYGKEILGASALFDVAKAAAPEKLKGYSLYVDQSRNGTPLLMLSGRFK